MVNDTYPRGKQSNYDEAVRLLKDLRDLAEGKRRATGARLRIRRLQNEHAGKLTFV